MKKFVKYLIYIIIISILIVAVFNQNTSVGNPGTFENKVNGKTGINSLADDFGEKIIGAIQAIGTITSVVILVILGIKYMLGSAEERAEYKKSMIPYLIGAILLFATPKIVGAIYTVLNG